jgi:hypothetical protein
MLLRSSKQRTKQIKTVEPKHTKIAPHEFRIPAAPRKDTRRSLSVSCHGRKFSARGHDTMSLRSSKQRHHSKQYFSSKHQLFESGKMAINSDINNNETLGDIYEEFDHSSQHNRRNITLDDQINQQFIKLSKIDELTSNIAQNVHSIKTTATNMKVVDSLQTELCVSQFADTKHTSSCAHSEQSRSCAGLGARCRDRQQHCAPQLHSSTVPAALDSSTVITYSAFQRDCEPARATRPVPRLQSAAAKTSTSWEGESECRSSSSERNNRRHRNKKRLFYRIPELIKVNLYMN